jgi:poly(beta-D-mannuronate) lyase
MKTLLSFSFLLASSFCVYAAEHLATTIEEANNFLKKAAAGDRVILKDGTYKDAIIRFHNTNGRKDQQIVFTAQTPGQVFFEGDAYLAFSGNYITIIGFTWRNGGNGLENRTVIDFRTGSDKFAYHSTISDCAIIDYNSDLHVDNKWIGIHGQHNTVTHCLLKDKKNLGATVTVWLTPGVEARHTISYNYFNGRHNGPNEDNGLESIRIGDSKTSFEPAHCVVALNLFEECNGEIEIISNKSFHNSYLHNSFVSSDGGLTLRHGNNCLVDGNFFDGNNKKLAYGVRFIGEGHVATNNYFYNLLGAPNNVFRAPVTLVTGVVNTPLNGYFQVRRAVVADNIFVNCATPNIRNAATPKRPGATLAPDSVLIMNNIFYDDKGMTGDIYEEHLPVSHLTVQNNTVIARGLRANVKGFDSEKFKGSLRDGFNGIQDSKGNNIASIKDKGNTKGFNAAGADWMPEEIAAATKGRKYTIISTKEVGPSWRL